MIQFYKLNKKQSLFDLILTFIYSLKEIELFLVEYKFEKKICLHLNACNTNIILTFI